MARITEDYVSFETAKLLKEKGFEGYSILTIYDENAAKAYIKELREKHLPFSSDDPKLKEFHYTKPTLQMAMKWLREVHKLYINVWADPKDVERNDFDIIFRAQVYNGTSNYGTYEFSTYEEACESAILYCLENLV